MAVTAHVTGGFLLSLANKEINLNTDTLKAMLLTSSFTPNYDTIRYKSDLSNEVTGTGYTAGGVTLTSQTVTYDSTNDRLVLDTDDAAWTGASFTSPRYCAVVDTTPSTDATRPVLNVIDFGASQTISGNFTVAINALGLLRFNRL